VFTGPRAYFQGRGFNWNDYIGGEQRKTVWFDQNKGQTVSNQGASLQTDWSVADHVLSSVTAVRQYRFDAHNDEGTPYDISVDGGGGVDYSQYTQEIKFKNNPGGFFDYKAGLFGMKTNDTIDSKQVGDLMLARVLLPMPNTISWIKMPMEIAVRTGAA